MDQPRDDGYYHNDDLRDFSKLLFYVVKDGELVQAPISIVEEQTYTVYLNFEVLDLNGDGLDDIAVYPYLWDVTPDVYLNVGNGELHHLDRSVFTAGPRWGGEQFPNGTSKFLDANGDGHYDLLYYTAHALPQYQIPQWQIHLGTGANMADFDTSPINIADRKGGTILTTWGGNDWISDVNASASPTRIDGGLGIDTMHYSGPRSSYGLSGSQHSWTVDSSLIDDTLLNVERVVFADSRVALDLDGHAGQAAKLLGVIVGSAENSDLVGLVMGYLDGGLAYETLMYYALEARLGASPSNGAVVDMVYLNLAGFAPSVAEHNFLLAYLDDGVVTQEQFAVIASEHSLNLTNIDFTGLVASGIEYH